MRSVRALASMGALASTACTVFTPPTRPFPLESAATVGKGRTGEQMEFGRSGSLDADSGTLRVSHGVARGTDLSIEAAGTNVVSDGKDRKAGDLHIWTSRVGVKQRIAKAFAVTAGLGGGVFADNPFIGPDVGVIGSYENRYLVPFAAARGAVSVPLAPREVDFGDGTATPRTEWYGQLALGARVPLGCGAPASGELRGSLLAGYSRTWFVDTRGNGSFDAFAVGGEITF